jgi:hypothetical protein
MNISAVDGILEAWSKRQEIPLQTSYRDENVRSFEFVGSNGVQFQIWIEPPAMDGSTIVHA